VGWKLWCSEAAAFEQASEPDIGPPSIPLGTYYEKDEMHIPSGIEVRIRGRADVASNLTPAF
jgi:hypothetical protein